VTGIVCHLRLGLIFLRASLVYWLQVFPAVGKEIKGWEGRARAIPDENLRTVALQVQRSKRGNLEGAAAFAAFAPRSRRAAVVRAQVTLQSIYDYADTLAEQPHDDPISNSQQLHQALLRALEPTRAQLDYYAYHSSCQDGLYLPAIVESCRSALDTLPSWPCVVPAANRFAMRIVNYQTFNVPVPGVDDPLKAWATNETPARLELRWWETAASAGSSLGIFALVALAARRSLTSAEAEAIEDVYFPWVGALHSLLDSLIDMEEDSTQGERNLVAQYVSAREAAVRMRVLARESRHRVELLPNAAPHRLVLAGMISFYLSAREAQLPGVRLATEYILRDSGAIALLARQMLRLRRKFVRRVAAD
jgi:tetraprenyl-beta-curcumene synthase